MKCCKTQRLEESRRDTCGSSNAKLPGSHTSLRIHSAGSEYKLGLEETRLGIDFQYLGPIWALSVGRFRNKSLNSNLESISVVVTRFDKKKHPQKGIQTIFCAIWTSPSQPGFLHLLKFVQLLPGPCQQGNYQKESVWVTSVYMQNMVKHGKKRS